MKKKQILFFLAQICIIAVVTFDGNAQITDIDGNSYKTVTIGKQVWMAENLNVSSYRNGDPIPQVQNKEEWASLTTGAWCYYDDNSGTGTGKIYNWYAVNDSRGLAPAGWHVPTDEEWTTVINQLGGGEQAGTIMKTTSGWEDDGNGTNSSGFTVLPGGYRNGDGYFNNLGRNGVFWSSTEFKATSAWFRNVIASIPDVYRHNYPKGFGLSIRCVKD